MKIIATFIGPLGLNLIKHKDYVLDVLDVETHKVSVATEDRAYTGHFPSFPDFLKCWNNITMVQESDDVKKWRTMLRVTSVNIMTYTLIVPAIGSKAEFDIAKSLIPKELVKGERFHAHTNLKAKFPFKLGLEQFEFD